MTGVERIAKERQRQIDHHNYSADHDDEHKRGELALAGAVYATPRRLYGMRDIENKITFFDPWPFDASYDMRPRDGDANVLDNNSLSIDRRIRQLEKAGAFMAAEIDRLLRLK